MARKLALLPECMLPCSCIGYMLWGIVPIPSNFVLLPELACDHAAGIESLQPDKALQGLSLQPDKALQLRGRGRQAAALLT